MKTQESNHTAAKEWERIANLRKRGIPDYRRGFDIVELPSTTELWEKMGAGYAATLREMADILRYMKRDESVADDLEQLAVRVADTFKVE